LAAINLINLLPNIGYQRISANFHSWYYPWTLPLEWLSV